MTYVNKYRYISGHTKLSEENDARKFAIKAVETLDEIGTYFTAGSNLFSAKYQKIHGRNESEIIMRVSPRGNFQPFYMIMAPYIDDWQFLGHDLPSDDAPVQPTKAGPPSKYPVYWRARRKMAKNMADEAELVALIEAEEERKNPTDKVLIAAYARLKVLRGEV